MKYKTNLYMILEAEEDSDARQRVQQLVIDLNELLGYYMGAEAILTWPEHFHQLAAALPAACEGLVELEMGDDDQEALTKEELKEILRAEGLEVFDWAEHVSDTKH